MAKNPWQKMKTEKTTLFLLLILFLATFLRFWQLDVVPPELFGDELDIGYHAYSLLKTGKDYYGQFLPTYIHSLAEWRAPLFVYSTIPFIRIFGLNEVGVRASPAFFGVLGIFTLYLLVKELFGNQRLALLAALLLVICPWHLHYSRAAFDATLFLFLFLLGTYFWLRGLKKSWFFILAAASFSLTLYTYNTAYVFLPLYGLSLVIISWQNLIKIKNKRILAFALIVFLIISLPIARQTITGRTGERFGYISIFSDPNILEEIHLKRIEALPPGSSLDNLPLIERIFHNRPLVWLQRISQNYLAALSFDFLFARGTPNPRQSIGGLGEFYLVELIFILTGIFVLLKKKNKSKWLIFSWLLLAPLPSSLTQAGGNHATRLFLMIPPITILSAYGLVQLIELAKKKKTVLSLLFIVCCLLLFNFSFYLHRYYVHYSKETWRWWHFGYKEAMTYVGENQDKYERVFLNNTYEPSLLRFLFWTQYDPTRFHQEFTVDQPQENILPGFDGFRLEKFYFGTLNEEGSFDQILSPKTLYLVSQKQEVGGDWDWRKEPPSEVRVLKTVTNPFGEPLFYLVTGK